jgi:hypothetical protein
MAPKLDPTYDAAVPACDSRYINERGKKLAAIPDIPYL